jgi:hypothetical protein
MIYIKVQGKIIEMNLKKQKNNKKKMMRIQKLINQIMEY